RPRTVVKFMFHNYSPKKPMFHSAQPCQAKAMPGMKQFLRFSASALLAGLVRKSVVAHLGSFLACLFQAGTHPAQTLAPLVYSSQRSCAMKFKVCTAVSGVLAAAALSFAA